MYLINEIYLAWLWGMIKLFHWIIIQRVYYGRVEIVVTVIV